VDPLSLILTLVAGKKHLVHLAVQVAKFAVGLLEKLFRRGSQIWKQPAWTTVWFVPVALEVRS
jgi:hypothetical protein